MEQKPKPNEVEDIGRTIVKVTSLTRGIRRIIKQYPWSSNVLHAWYEGDTLLTRYLREELDRAIERKKRDERRKTWGMVRLCLARVLAVIATACLLGGIIDYIDRCLH